MSAVEQKKLDFEEPAEADSGLPPIPQKRYFAIGEVSDLCDVKPHVLRYWEQEFPQLKPVKRRGNRRYYKHHDVMMVRRIRNLLYEQGFTIGGARQRLHDNATTDVAEPVDRKQALKEIRYELESLLEMLEAPLAV